MNWGLSKRLTKVIHSIPKKDRHREKSFIGMEFLLDFLFERLMLVMGPFNGFYYQENDYEWINELISEKNS